MYGTKKNLILVLFALVITMVVLPSSAAPEPQTPEQMYDYAVKQLDRGYFEKAVIMFERIKTRYPFSRYAVLSELRIGDSHFKRGQYPEAIDAYRNFIKLHPKHPEMDYVIYRIGLSQFKEAPKISQRDQTSTRQMLATTQSFADHYPSSEYLDEVAEMRAEGRERLARALFGIGQFYFRRGRYQVRDEERKAPFDAAIRRFEQVLDDYPDVRDVGADSLCQIGFLYVRLKDEAGAVDTLGRLRERFPEAREQAIRLAARVNHLLKRSGDKNAGEEDTGVSVPPVVSPPDVETPEPLEKVPPPPEEEDFEPSLSSPDSPEPAEESVPAPPSTPEATPPPHQPLKKMPNPMP